MKCPHCSAHFVPEEESFELGNDSEGEWSLYKEHCPACERFVIELIRRTRKRVIKQGESPYIVKEIICHPQFGSTRTAPVEVPSEAASDFNEAATTLAISPKASAALSRRCLQGILRDIAGVNPGNLANEIEQTLKSGQLPSHLAESLDAIRNIGNFAAHPGKSDATGEIIDVEGGEADWNLEVLELLMDFFYVQPAKTKARQDALNVKLSDSGKPPMKQGKL